ncbi:DUF4304 domain-containing protein [Arthrobacter alpinus]|uniref:DUF4304 domain-containing protein n=1 Tax=Arthrobacter alpinus TaxID=656366 RepID=UPI000A41FC53|nr:DUF4304 domain-containing protein [Arthrobacter alpinus]
MDTATTIETTFASVLKARGFRKRGRNWFRTTQTDDYQIVNLQKSPWGGDFYVNLGWSLPDATKAFRSEIQCDLRLRAEATDVVLPITLERSDGLTAQEVPGTILLDTGVSERIPEETFIRQLTDVIVVPVADLMDRTPSLVHMVPFLMTKPWFATLALRKELELLGHKLPTKWR